LVVPLPKTSWVAGPKGRYEADETRVVPPEAAVSGRPAKSNEYVTVRPDGLVISDRLPSRSYWQLVEYVALPIVEPVGVVPP